MDDRRCGVGAAGGVRAVPAGAGATGVGGRRRAGPTAEQWAGGLVWLLPGIEGVDWKLCKVRRAFRAAGVEGVIKTYRWPKPFGMLLNLMDYASTRAEAARMAGEIAGYRRAYPARPVDLVGYSAGGGLAVMIVEALPADVQVRYLILVHPALSPSYDLTGALRHVERKLVNFHSARDWFMLGVGTRLFGTVDRVNTVAAGNRGFEPNGTGADWGDKLEQRRWEKEMRAAGHRGGHTLITAAQWNRQYVAPYLLGPR